jgi:hypothetical protein
VIDDQVVPPAGVSPNSPVASAAVSTVPVGVPSDTAISDDNAAAPDDTAAAPDDAAAPTTTTPGDKSPLDILEGLLNEAKNKNSGSGDSSTDSGVDTSVLDEILGDDEKSEVSSEDQVKLEAQKQAEEAERQKLIAQQAIVDQEKLIAQQAAMEEIKSTPQYQARIEQNEEQKNQQAQKDASQSGYEIVQLDHKKI